MHFFVDAGGRAGLMFGSGPPGLMVLGLRFAFCTSGSAWGELTDRRAPPVLVSRGAAAG